MAFAQCCSCKLELEDLTTGRASIGTHSWQEGKQAGSSKQCGCRPWTHIQAHPDAAAPDCKCDMGYGRRLVKGAAWGFLVARCPGYRHIGSHGASACPDSSYRGNFLCIALHEVKASQTSRAGPLI